MKKEKHRPKAFKTIAVRITALVLGVWLLSMLFLTWAVARDFRNQIQDTAEGLAGRHLRFNYSGISSELPGCRDMLRIMALGEPYSFLRTDQLLPFVLPQTPDSYSMRDWIYGKWELMYGFQPAMIFYDEDRNILMRSGNVLAFTYCTEALWQAQTPAISGYGYIDLEAMPYGQEALTTALWGFARSYLPSSFSSPLLRMTGYFEGAKFVPISIDRQSDYFSQEHSPETNSRRDSIGYLDWENVYTFEAFQNRELTTIYSWETGGYEYEHKSVTIGGVEYDSLVTLLDAATRDLENYYTYQRGNLFDTIILAWGKPEGDPEVDYHAVAVRCWPMQYAALRLIPTYLVSFGLVAVALWLLLRSIKRNVTNTLEMLVHRATTDAPIEHLSGWQEPHALEAILKNERERRRSLLNENRQLQKSLEYAKNAEENRRQLVSNITHELKTPLAIIHSYAEGLQSGIAEEKKEKYLSTILEEAERMDAMVLEMLDHSRLESGKVKLSADHFSLLKLTETIAEKLAPAMAEKQLILSWGFTNECMLTADEARMGQVVANLLTNAVRYTPEGGVIHLRVFSDAKDATFQIENEAEHLPAEVLEKIFETFYRFDESRTEKGTGLGLPIARSIVELHRGRIQAMNTYVNRKSCVQFMFTIPLK